MEDKQEDHEEILNCLPTMEQEQHETIQGFTTVSVKGRTQN